MKTLIFLFAALVLTIDSTYAQAPAAHPAQAATQTPKTTTHVTKRDTQDHRHKENKAASRTRRRKDGTRDRHYKANKKKTETIQQSTSN
jgi:Ni/Co efflux regulator RcnB